MILDNQARRIVVGYDGSPASRAGLALAADHAGDDGRVYVVHAYSLPDAWIGAPDYQRLLDVVLGDARTCVEPLDGDAGAALRGVDWEVPERAVERAAQRPAALVAS